MVRVADIVAQACYAYGIRYAFGMPGGEVVMLVDALAKHGIDFVLARNETAAAMMAAGTSPAGTVPGLLVTTLGPGLANALNGIADAAQERNPLLVISGVVERNIRARYTHQIVDHAALLRPLVKASFEIEPDGAAALVARAIALAMTPPFGPVHLDLSPAVASTLVEQGAIARASVITPVASVSPGHAAIAAMRARLSRSERPLIIAGLDAARAHSGASLLALAECLGAPVITTYKAKGLIDEHHALSLGAAGLSPLADGILLPLVKGADVVLLVGYDPIEMRPGWLDPFAQESHVVELTTFAHDHGMHGADERLCAPLTPMLDGLKGDRQRASWARLEPQQARSALQGAFAGPESWGPHAIFRTLQERLPDYAVLSVDSGAHRILLSQMWRANRPFALLQSAGWCTMGSAIPLAIGQQIINRDACVVAILGDGGLEMTLGELGTLRDAGLPVIVIVLQDESLALIALKQVHAGLPSAGVCMGATRYADIASAFGGHGVAVNSIEGLEIELDHALIRRNTFSLIACRIEAGCYIGSI